MFYIFWGSPHYSGLHTDVGLSFSISYLSAACLSSGDLEKRGSYSPLIGQIFIVGEKRKDQIPSKRPGLPGRTVFLLHCCLWLSRRKADDPVTSLVLSSWHRAYHSTLRGIPRMAVKRCLTTHAAGRESHNVQNREWSRGTRDSTTASQSHKKQH